MNCVQRPPSAVVSHDVSTSHGNQHDLEDWYDCNPRRYVRSKQSLSHFRGWLGPRERNCKKAGFRAWVLWNIATHSFSPLFLLHHKLSSHQIRFLIIFHIHLFHFTFYTSRTFCLTLFIYPFTSSFVLSRTFHLALFIILCHRL